MNTRFLFFLPVILLIASYSNAQVFYNTDASEIGILRLEPDSSFSVDRIFSRRNNEESFVLPDLTLHPNGKIYAIKGCLNLMELDLKMNRLVLVDSFPRVSNDPCLSALESDKNGLIYAAGSHQIITYDVKTKGFRSQIDGGLHSKGDIIIVEDRVLVASRRGHIFEIDKNTLQRKDTAAFLPYTGDGFFGITHMGGEIIGAEDYGLNTNRTDTTFIHQVDLERSSSRIIGKIPRTNFFRGIEIWGLTSSEPFRSNPNMYLDLDENDSSGRFLSHYQVDTFCVRQLPLLDRDARLETTIGIDSISIEIAHDTLLDGERLTIGEVLPVFRVQQPTQGKIILNKPGSNQLGGFLEALHQIRYDVSAANPFTAERKVAITMYSAGQVSDVSNAYLKIDLNRVPYAGLDGDTLICFNRGFDPRVPLGADADRDGRWEPSLSSNNNFLLNTARDTNAVYQYITQTGECPADTATLTVRLHEIDDIRQRFELVEPIFLCDENDSITVDISVKNGVYYDWNSERNETGIFSVTEPVVYHYYVTDENSCVQSGIFAGRIDSERAGVQTSETLQLCQSEPYQYQGITYTQDTLLCETFSRLSGCDSTHCLQLRFDEVSTVNKLTATICQGQVFDLFGELLTESGLYSSRKVRAGQCDSLVDLTLIVTRPNETLVDTLLPLGTVLEYNGFTFDEPGTSFLYITNPTNGCDSIIRLQLDFTTSLEELEREELQIALYPNPPTSTTQLHFQTPVRQKVEIRILDYTGRQLRTQDVQILRGATTTPVDLPDSSGIYWVQVLVEGQVGRNFRVVKR